MQKILIYFEGIRIAIRSLKANRLRTILTMLGVSIGIFAITIIFTIVNSLNYNLNRNLSELGNSVLFVYHFPWSGESFGNWQKYVKRPRVNFQEYQQLKKNLTRVEGVSLEARMGGQTLKYSSKTVNGAQLRCVTQDYVANNALEIGLGRPFTDLEADAGRPVCILGHTVAENLFGDLYPVGREIRMRGKNLRVIGVLEKSGANMFGDSPDGGIYVPYGFGARMYDMSRRRVDKYIMVKARDVRDIDLIENDIIGLMRSSRGLRPKAENDFSINRPEMLLDVFENVTKYLRSGGLFISIFAVIVAGFGIGNIMFTTVKERTFEIGLQKSLGAERGVILFQFLMESVLLCLVGGIFGLLLNFGVAASMQALIDSMEIDFEVVISTSSVLFGVFLSVIIGLASGVIPSVVASKLDPVEAMRR